MRMFGTNGIRGIANKTMTCELALGIGKAVGAVLGNKVAVASDPRTSSQMIKSALCAGLMSVGTDVLDLGMIPTPALQHYIKTRDDICGGVMITASHNPPEFNGIKCIAADGTECTKEQEDSIETAFHDGVQPSGWHELGRMETIQGAAEEYVDSIVSNVDSNLIRRSGIKIVLDCANGCACSTSPLILKMLGVEAIVINGEPDMRDPGHLSEPTADNLTELMRKVTDSNADLGIAHDGDADRCVFVASDGAYVPGDKALAILGRYLLGSHEGGKIVVTVATSKIVEDTCAPVGGEVIYTAVGSPVVARTMASDGAIFGGEENGGLIFAEHQLCRDGGMGAAVMLECLAKNGTLTQILSTLPSYTTIKVAVVCPDDLKNLVTEAIASKHPDERKDTTDGLKFLYEDGWVLLRASGTEPKYRIYSESKDASKAKERSERFVEEFEETLKALSKPL